jgi:hypothetical protein
VIAHLMKTQRMSLSDALKFVKERRRIVKPNTGFVEQLKQWEKMIEDNTIALDDAFTRRSVSEMLKQHEDRQNQQKQRNSPSPTRASAKLKSPTALQTGGEELDFTPGFDVRVRDTARYSVLDIMLLPVPT